MANYPSTKSLRAFEAVARLGSVKAAADYLHLSASAISRRVQTLEEDLGQSLFKRNVQGLVLTEAGMFYAQRLREIFKSLDDATLAMQHRAKRRLTVVAPAVVVAPCMEELHDIERSLPGVDLLFETAVVRSASEPILANADIAFFWGKARWDGWTTSRITPRTHLVPLCSSTLLTAGTPLTTEELARQTWITISTFEEAWEMWFEAVGVPMPTPKRIMKVADVPTAALVAQKGGGVFIGTGFGQLPNFSVLLEQLSPAHAFHAFAPDYALHLGVRDNNENPDVDIFNNWFFHKVWNLAALRRRAGLNN